MICLVYAFNDEISKKKLQSYWIPKITEASQDMLRPIVIVANKCEINDRNSLLLNDLFISKLLNNQIETCIQCSAKTLNNIPEVFYYAQKSVLYPTGPLFNQDTQKLTIECIKSLVRIFRLCDYDNDNLLNDNELKEFQLKCFGINLNVNSLQEVKDLLKNTTSDGEDLLINNEITLSGFLHLHLLFVKKGRQETTWTVLKKFGYCRNLSMSRDFITIKYGFELKRLKDKNKINY